MEIGPVEELARDSIEKGLGALGLPVLDDEADELALDLCPERIVGTLVGATDTKVALDALDGLGDAPVVEIDAITSDVANGEPVGRFEIMLCRARAVAKQGVMPVEAFEKDGCDLRRGRVWADAARI